MQLLPVPTSEEWLRGLADLWLPFMPSIAERAKVPVEVLIQEVADGTTQVHLVWDGQKAHALVGTRIVAHGERKVLELVWCTGEDKDLWFDLVDELERYAVEHLGITTIRAIARLGWQKPLKRKGYSPKHIILEKELA
jgi:hypothetical protein